jgi:hypothetical protein
MRVLADRLVVNFTDLVFTTMAYRTVLNESLRCLLEFSDALRIIGSLFQFPHGLGHKSFSNSKENRDPGYHRQCGFSQGLPNVLQKFGIIHGSLEKGFRSCLERTLFVCENVSSVEIDLSLSITTKPSPAGSRRSRIIKSGSFFRATVTLESAFRAKKIS